MPIITDHWLTQVGRNQLPSALSVQKNAIGHIPPLLPQPTQTIHDGQAATDKVIRNVFDVSTLVTAAKSEQGTPICAPYNYVGAVSLEYKRSDVHTNTMGAIERSPCQTTHPS